MQHDTKGLIEELQAKLAVLATYYPEASYLFEGAQNAIRTSSGRAVMDETRTSLRARMSIASSLGSILDWVSRSDDAGRYVARLWYSILKIGRALIETAQFDTEPLELDSAPDGWMLQPEGKLSKTTTKGDVFLISKRPHLPGGDWCLSYFNLPISFSTGLTEILQRAEVVNDMIGRAVRLPSMPMPTTRASEPVTTIPELVPFASAIEA